jgi:hypothetical protein
MFMGISFVPARAPTREDKEKPIRRLQVPGGKVNCAVI